jgi:hypothetical protein
MLGVGAFLLVAGAWNGPELRRRWESRNDLRVVSTLEELERQREVVIDGVPMKLGVETLTPALEGALLVYALWTGPGDVEELRFHGEPFSTPTLPIHRTVSSERHLWVRSLGVVHEGEKLQEIVDREGQVRARFRTTASAPRFHAFFPLAPLDKDGDYTLAEGGAVPHVEGEVAVSADLPRFPASDASHTLRLTHEGETFTLSLGRNVPCPEAGVPNNALLCRLWVNDVPLQPPLWKDLNPLRGPDLGGPAVSVSLEHLVFRLRLDAGKLGVHPGDRIGVQCYFGGGWRPREAANSTHASSYEWNLALLSNRVELTLP